MSKVVPEGWEQKNIGELVTLKYGKSPKEILSKTGNYPVIGTGGITGYSSSFLHEGGTTVIGRKGSINNPSYIEGPFWAIDTTYYSDNYKGVDPRWFYYSLKAIDLMRYNEASGVPSLNRDTLCAIPLLKPPFAEQQKIATILSSVDNVIEKTRTQIDKLKDLKTGMMQELLTKGIGHTEFKDSPVGRIPKVWEVGTIADLGEIITGNTPKTSDSSNYGGKIPFVSPADLGDAAYIEITKSCITEKGLLETRELPRGSVCVVCIGSTIGKTGITKKRSATNQQINSIICERAYSEYVYYLLTHYSEKIKSEAGTQAVPIINKSSFSRLQVQIPLYYEQIKIGNTLSGVDFKISVITRKLTSLEKIKKALMQDLLTGKVRINDDTLTYSHSLRQEPVSITEILDENKAQYNN